MSEPNEIAAALQMMKMAATALIAATESPNVTPALIAQTLNGVGMAQQKFNAAVQNVALMPLTGPMTVPPMPDEEA